MGSKRRVHGDPTCVTCVVDQACRRFAFFLNFYATSYVVYCGFYCGFGSGSGVHCVHFGMIYGPNTTGQASSGTGPPDRTVFVSLRSCNGSDSSCGLCVVLVCARVRYTTYSCSSY